MKRSLTVAFFILFFAISGSLSANTPTEPKEEVWITHSSFLNAQISLPAGYRETSMGMIGNRGEVQAFIHSKDPNKNQPYFALTHYFKDQNTPRKNTSSYFADQKNVTAYYEYFLKDYYELGEGRQGTSIFPKFSSDVVVYQGEHILGIHVDTPPIEKRSYYIWAHPEGFFVVVATYRKDGDNEFIQKVISSFKLPEKELTER